MTYLDNAASTPVHKEVLQDMIPFFSEKYGNPSSMHKSGRMAFNAVQKARKQIANLINANPEEILITSGGTESNNTALYGISNVRKGNHIITSSIEHEAILEPCKKLEKHGFRITYLPVSKDGLVNPSDIKNSISKDTCLVSIMFANNEVGTIQPIREITEICKKNNVAFHSDAVQAVGKIPINVKELEVSTLSFSSHKIYGPKGVGALYIKNGTKIDPILLGGGQENGLRSGTENVASIVGFGKACELALKNFEQNSSHVKKLRDLLVSKIIKEISFVKFNGNNEKRIPNNAHFTFLGVNGEDLIIKLDENGIAASTGSACSVKTQKASHVLQAMGFSHEELTGSLRLTIGIFNTTDEIYAVIDVLKKIVKELRSVSPFKEKYGF